MASVSNFDVGAIILEGQMMNDTKHHSLYKEVFGYAQDRRRLGNKNKFPPSFILYCSRLALSLQHLLIQLLICHKNYSLHCLIKWQTLTLPNLDARKSIWLKKKCPALWLFAKNMENRSH